MRVWCVWGVRVIIRVGLVLTAVLAVLEASANESKENTLIACPDCGKEVSRRAVHCPACGCPGGAIAEEANRIKDAKMPKPVVFVVAPGGGGYGVSVEQGGKFVIALVGGIGSGESLSLKSLTDQDVSYSAVEGAENLPLVRFTVQSDQISYLPVSQSGEKSGFLNVSGHQTAMGPGVCVALDASGAASALIDPASGVAIPLTESVRWISIRPADFREQVGLLASARSKASAGKLDKETLKRLRSTEWATKHFESAAKEIISANP